MITENVEFQSLNGDQSREFINTQQRFSAWITARHRATGYRGSMHFSRRGETDYLLRDYYDPKSGLKRQRSLGQRDAETEKLHAEFVKGKADAAERLKKAADILQRQAAVNRALGLGRVPGLGAKIIRAVDAAGLLGKGLKVIGTNALYAYEAASGVRFDTEITTTEDIDLLFDARVHLRFVAEDDVTERTLLGLLKKTDHSFVLSERSFQAVNDEGYFVDLIKPLRNPPWLEETSSVSSDKSDVEAVQIEGLAWHENAPAFEAIAVDARGFPLRIVAPDPRAFVVHKLWLSERTDRSPLKRRRDAAQARAVAALVATHLPHLFFEKSALRNFPKETVEKAAPLFAHRAAADF